MKTAVVNPKKRKRDSKGRYKKNPARAYGAAAKPTANRKRKAPRRKNNGHHVSPYSSGGYYRRPNKAKSNPSALDMETWTRVLPAGVAGIWVTRWAVAMAGPFEPDATGQPVPGFKHFVAGILAVEVGGRIVGDILGARRETDIAQIAGISYIGDLFLRKRVLRDSPWVQKNISLEGHGQNGALPANANGGLGSDKFTDAAGNQYTRTSEGWQLANWQYSAALGQPGGEQVQIPPGAKPGDVIRTPSGAHYQLNGDGKTLGHLTDSAAARALVAPTTDLPGGSTPSDMSGFYNKTPLGSFMEHTPLGQRYASNGSSFGYGVGRG